VGPHALLLLLFASAIPAADASLLQPAPSRLQQLEPPLADLLRDLDRIAHRFGDPLLACQDTATLDAEIRRIAESDEFLAEYIELARRFMHVKLEATWQLDAMPDLIESVLQPFDEETRGMFLQALAVSLDIWRRRPVLSSVEIPPPEIAQRDLAKVRDSDENFRIVLGGSACGLGVARMLAGPGNSHPGLAQVGYAPKVPRDVALHLVHRWFDANRTLLAAVDPIQAALDGAVGGFPESTRGAVVRVAYAWDTSENDLDGPSLVIWLVLRDDADPKARMVSGNVELMRAIGRALEASSAKGVPFFLRLRMATEFA
jgi:hypothetical protein